MKSVENAVNPQEILREIAARQGQIRDVIIQFEAMKARGEKSSVSVVVLSNIAGFYEKTEISWARLEIDYRTYLQRLADVALRLQEAVNDQGAGVIANKNRDFFDKVYGR